MKSLTIDWGGLMANVEYNKELYKKGELELIDLILKEHGYISLSEMSDDDYDDTIEMVADEPWYYSDTIGPAISYFSIIETHDGTPDECFEAGNKWLKEYTEFQIS